MDDTGHGRPTPPGEPGAPTVLFGAETDAALETHYLVIPDEVWRAQAESDMPGGEDLADEYEEDGHDPQDQERQRTSMSRTAAGSVGGVTAALVAGVIPSLIVGPPAALVAGVVAGVVGGLLGHAVGVGVHDRKRGTDSGSRTEAAA
jgi:hypothetical protein